MRKVVILLICCFITGLNISLLADDSIPPAKELQDVVVYGERSWIENGVINVIPSKKEKKLSDSPGSLIKVMNLPFLQEKNGVIVNMIGEEVPIFINGERADKIDLSAFWPMEVKRVQYLENPADPTFEGERIALNFIMDKYEVGGVTRVGYFHRIPNYGSPDLASKLAYKKMTYGAYVDYICSRDHRSSSDGETKYRNLYYNGEFYDEITNSEENSIFNRHDYMNAAVNAKYTGSRCRITHTLSLRWEQDPGSGLNGTGMWTDNLFGSTFIVSRNSSRSLSPQFSGNYWFNFDDKWYLTGTASYSYGRNRKWDMNRFGDAEAVSNRTDETVNTAVFQVKPTYMPSGKWMFQMRLMSILDWYSTRYSGSTETLQRQSRQEISLSGYVGWNPSSDFSVSLTPRIIANLWRIGDIKGHTVSPICTAYARWAMSRKASVSLSVNVYMKAPGAAESNPVLVRNTDLLWVMGNPYLKTLKSWDFYIYSNFMINDWFSMSPVAGLTKTYDGVVATYEAASQEMGGLIRRNVNAGTEDWIRTGCTFTGAFFDRSLSVRLSPSWEYTHTRNPYRMYLNRFSFSGSVDYTIGDFMVGVEYNGPNKYVSDRGMSRKWRQSYLDFSATYGTGDIFVRFKVENLFNNKRKEWIKMVTPCYERSYNNFETGRAFVLSVSYTFGYGKKVNRSIDVQGPASVKTSVIN